MPSFVIIVALIGGLYFTISGLLLLLNQPSLETRLMQWLKIPVGRKSNAPLDPEARRWAVGLLLTNGPIWFILGLLASACYFAPWSDLCVFL
jgi:hypothetical protein